MRSAASPRLIPLTDHPVHKLATAQAASTAHAFRQHTEPNEHCHMPTHRPANTALQLPQARTLRLRSDLMGRGPRRARCTCCHPPNPSHAPATRKLGAALLAGRQTSGLSTSSGMRDAPRRPHLGLEPSDAHEEAPRWSRLRAPAPRHAHQRTEEARLGLEGAALVLKPRGGRRERAPPRAS